MDSMFSAASAVAVEAMKIKAAMIARGSMPNAMALYRKKHTMLIE
jgi:hypothetical protein